MNDDSGMTKTTTTALGIGTIAGLGLGTIIYKAAVPLCTFYCKGQTDLIYLSATYVRIRALALPFSILAMIAQAACIGVKDSSSPMRSVVLAAIINFFGDLLLVSKFGQGIGGAAWATAISQVCACGLLLRSLFKRSLLKPITVMKSKDGVRKDVQSILSFAPFVFVMLMKMFMHNSAAIAGKQLYSYLASNSKFQI